MDAIAVARSMRGSVGMLAMDWLMDPSTLSEAAKRGMADGTGAYAAGRLGVLGNCPVDNVVAAAYFWNPSTMREAVEQGRAAMSPAQGALIWGEICADFGAKRLAGMEGAARLGELLERVVDAAAPHGAPTFVGWRDLPRPPTGGASHAFFMAQIMRELRFGRHCVAVQALGMEPLEAILSGPAGEWNAEFFGWSKPYPDVSHLSDTREQIESLTDKLHAPDFEVLTPAERAEVRELAKAARFHDPS